MLLPEQAALWALALLEKGLEEVMEKGFLNLKPSIFLSVNDALLCQKTTYFKAIQKASTLSCPSSPLV